MTDPLAIAKYMYEKPLPHCLVSAINQHWFTIYFLASPIIFLLLYFVIPNLLNRVKTGKLATLVAISSFAFLGNIVLLYILVFDAIIMAGALL